MQTVLSVLHILSCLGLIALVLLQQGKGATAGTAFGNGASQTIFGSQGSTSFLFKLTAGFAVVFFVACIGLDFIAKHREIKLVESVSPVSLETLAEEQKTDSTKPSVNEYNSASKTSAKKADKK